MAGLPCEEFVVAVRNENGRRGSVRAGPGDGEEDKLEAILPGAGEGKTNLESGEIDCFLADVAGVE